MKISIITVCYNSEHTIKDTLESVLKQTYQNYEYLIIDGKSKDKTLSIIKEYEPKFKGKLRYISEKDKGLYDAMNKGIKMATGKIIGIINSDDVLANKSVFSTIIHRFKTSNCDGTYSNLEILDKYLQKKVRIFYPKTGNYQLGWYPPHPTLYLKQEVYKKIGFYNQEYRIAADYDMMLRIMKDSNINLSYIDKVLVYMRAGGVSTNGLKGYYNSFLESYHILKKQSVRFPFLVNVIRTVKIFIQILKSKVIIHKNVDKE